MGHGKGLIKHFQFTKIAIPLETAQETRRKLNVISIFHEIKRSYWQMNDNDRKLGFIIFSPLWLYEQRHSIFNFSDIRNI